MELQHEKFQLNVYDGDFGLPSFDVECTKSLLYMYVATIPVQVNVLNSFKRLALQSALRFKHKNLHFRSYNEIVLYLRTLQYNIDRALNPKELSETLAITNLVQAKFRPVLEFFYWLDQRNCEEFTTVWCMKALPFPFNYVYARRFRNRAVDIIETYYPTENHPDVIKDFLVKSATECLSVLSTRLGTEDYFHGKCPTSLDVVVYSYLAPLTKLPFPSNDMKVLITMWPNLMNLIKRIDSTYFPDLPRESKYLKEEEKPNTGDDDVSYLAILILTVSATSLVLGFAFSKGLISPKFLS